MEKVKNSIRVTFMSVKRKINKMYRNNSFEIFGLDYMIDDLECRPWLI